MIHNFKGFDFLMFRSIMSLELTIFKYRNSVDRNFHLKISVEYDNIMMD
jgi:hypothetical protein